MRDIFGYMLYLLKDLAETLVGMCFMLSAIGLVLLGMPLWFPIGVYFEKGLIPAIFFAIIFWPASAAIICGVIADSWKGYKSKT